MPLADLERWRAWADVVLPPGYRAGSEQVYVDWKCACQGGRSGWCTHDSPRDHDRCPRSEGWHRHGQPDPETYVISRREWGARTAVWLSGRPCRSLCSCRCHVEVQALIPAPVRVALPPRDAGRIAATDSTYRESGQLALWEVSP